MCVRICVQDTGRRVSEGLEAGVTGICGIPACYLGDELWFSWLRSKHPNSRATSSLSDFKGQTDFTCNTCLLLEARGLGVQVIIAYREYSLDYM